MVDVYETLVRCNNRCSRCIMGQIMMYRILSEMRFIESLQDHITKMCGEQTSQHRMHDRN